MRIKSYSVLFCLILTIFLLFTNQIHASCTETTCPLTCAVDGRCPCETLSQASLYTTTSPLYRPNDDCTLSFCNGYCLNGDTPYRTNEDYMCACICPEGYSGLQCEQDDTLTIYQVLNIRYSGPNLDDFFEWEHFFTTQSSLSTFSAIYNLDQISINFGTAQEFHQLGLVNYWYWHITTNINTSLMYENADTPKITITTDSLTASVQTCLFVRRKIGGPYPRAGPNAYPAYDPIVDVYPFTQITTVDPSDYPDDWSYVDGELLTMFQLPEEVLNMDFESTEFSIHFICFVTHLPDYSSNYKDILFNISALKRRNPTTDNINPISVTSWEPFFYTYRTGIPQVTALNNIQLLQTPASLTLLWALELTTPTLGEEEIHFQISAFNLSLYSIRYLDCEYFFTTYQHRSFMANTRAVYDQNFFNYYTTNAAFDLPYIGYDSSRPIILQCGLTIQPYDYTNPPSTWQEDFMNLGVTITIYQPVDYRVSIDAIPAPIPPYSIPSITISSSLLLSSSSYIGAIQSYIEPPPRLQRYILTWNPTSILNELGEPNVEYKIIYQTNNIHFPSTPNEIVLFTSATNQYDTNFGDGYGEFVLVPTALFPLDNSTTSTTKLLLVTQGDVTVADRTTEVFFALFPHYSLLPNCLQLYRSKLDEVHSKGSNCQFNTECQTTTGYCQCNTLQPLLIPKIGDLCNEDEICTELQCGTLNTNQCKRNGNDNYFGCYCEQGLNDLSCSSQCSTYLCNDGFTSTWDSITGQCNDCSCKKLCTNGTYLDTTTCQCQTCSSSFQCTAVGYKTQWNTNNNQCECIQCTPATDSNCNQPPEPPQCTLTCGKHQQLNEQSCQCECINNWIDITTQCRTCGLTCNQPNIIPDLTTCDKCKCTTNFGGDNCQTCVMNTCSAPLIPNEQCNGCITQFTSTCTNTGYFGGDKSNRCLLSCLNSGRVNLDCTTCMCNKGYSGLQCQCREISFQLTLNSVPIKLLQQFEQNQSTTTNQDILQYITQQLTTTAYTTIVASDLIEASLKITSVELLSSNNNDETKQLLIRGKLIDNCQITNNNNYLDLRSQWNSFLNSLKTVNLYDETIPTIDVVNEEPQDPCDNIIGTPGTQCINSTFMVSIFLSFIIMIIVILV